MTSMRTIVCLAATIALAVLPQPALMAGNGTPERAPPPDPEYVRKMIPTKIVATYHGGDLVELRVRDRKAYLVRPTGRVDPQKRWIWFAPSGWGSTTATATCSIGCTSRNISPPGFTSQGSTWAPRA